MHQYKFTFKVSRFSLRHVRQWLADLSISRLTKRVYGHSSNKGHSRFLNMADQLRESTSSLLKTVRLLWKHFEIAEADQVAVLGLEEDNLSPSIIDVARLNFILMEEYHHYAKRLKHEKELAKDESSKALRIAPYWLRQEQSHLEWVRKYDKENWKYEWQPEDGLREWRDFSGDIAFGIADIIVIAITTGFLVVPIIYIMLQPENIITLIANFLAGMARQSHVTFPVIYTCFAVAIFILLSFAMAIFVSIHIPRPNISEMMQEMDWRMHERLAELAYQVIHDQGTQLENIENSAASIDLLNKTLEEFAIKEGLA